MDKRDFFLAGLRAESYRYKRWVLSCFSLISKQFDNAEQLPARDEHPYQLYRDKTGYFFRDPNNQLTVTRIEKSDPSHPLFSFREVVQLKASDIPNLKKDITSTYGNLFVNQTVLCYAFGDKLEYMEGAIAVPRIERIIAKLVRDDPPPGAERDPKAMYVDELKRYKEAIFSLAGYTQLCVPSATPRTMTTDPKIAVRRKELMEQYKDRLSDPVIQAKIEKELIAMDRAWIAGDPDKGFYYRDKSFDIVRKRLYISQGSEQGFGIKGDYISESLRDGWNVKNLPAMSNALRDGSYNRGSQTMLGGEATKFNYRVFQNTSITEEDCGSLLGLKIPLTEFNSRYFISNSVIDKGKVIELTDENVSNYVGKVVSVRSPLYCKTSGNNFCAVCIGKKIAATPRAIPTYAADIGSLFLSLFMRSMHGKALQVAVWEPSSLR